MRGGVLYIAFVREDSEAIGFVKKIKSQCKALSNLKHRTYLFITTANHANLYEISFEELILRKSISYTNKAKYVENREPFKNKISSYFRFNEFLRIIEDELDDLKIKNIYYRRMKPITFKLFKFLEKCERNNIRVFYEFPDYPTYPPNPKEIGRYLDFYYDKFLFSMLRRRIHKVVGIAYKKIQPNKDIILIKNGIDLKDTPLKKENHNKNLNLLCIANVAHWHAYDRLIKGMKNYYSNDDIDTKVFFHIVGEGNELENLKKLVKNLNLTKKVIFYGAKTGNELDGIVNKCDIGIGALGTHRVNIFGNSSLKNREYCARGLPFVLAANDYDFSDEFEYKLQVPTNETDIDVKMIVSFYKKFRKNNDVSIEMREYAEKHLSWESKLLPVEEQFLK